MSNDSSQPGQMQQPSSRSGARRRRDRTAAGAEARKLPLTISRPELLIDGSDSAFRRLVHGLFGFLARHEEIRAGHAKFIGLGGAEYTVLISIAHLSTRGEVNIKTVASHLHLSGAFITSVAQRLLKLGLIRKKVDPQDRRRVTLTVSEEGYQRLEQLAPVQRRVNDVEFDCLTAEDFSYLLELVSRLIDSSNRAVALQKYLLSERVE